MLIGASNEGKTTTAASASSFFPERLPATGQVDLSDLRWILFDNDGLSGFRRLGLNADCFDLSKVPLENIKEAVNAALDACEQELKAGTKKTIIIDSISVLDKSIQALVRQREDVQGVTMWGAILNEHAKIFSKVKALSGNVICTCHLTEVKLFGNEEQQQKQRTKLKAEGLEEGQLKMDICGQAYRFYRDNFSEIWPVKAIGRAPSQEYFVFPYGYDGAEHKTKQNCFEKKEPANIKKLVEKALAI
jgi:hypothetical protein